MAKAAEIVIDNWQKGIADSPFAGFADMRNVEIGLIPGLLLASLAASKKSGTTITGRPMWTRRNPGSGDIFMLDTDGKLYKSTDNGANWSLVSGNTLPTAGQGGQGLGIWKDYVIVARAANLDVYGPLSSSPAWTNAWQSLNSDSATHPIEPGPDNILYIGNSTTTGLTSSIATASYGSATLVPGSATFTSAALTLPGKNRVRSLQFLGDRLMIGTFVGTNTHTTLSSTGLQKFASIFPWKPAMAAFDLPIELGDTGVNQMITINNLLYVQAGQMGNWYVTNGASSRQLFRLPRYGTLADQYRQITVYPDAVAFHKGRLLFGLTFNASGSGTGRSGVYSVNLDGSGLALENTISTGGVDASATIGTVFAINDFNYDFLIGWQDGTGSAQGVDLVGENDCNTSYSAYVDSQVFTTGTTTQKFGFNEAQIYLDRPLASGQGVRLAYRTDTSASFTTIATIDFSTYGAQQSFTVPFGAATEQVQFRISLTGTASPRLKHVICR